MQLIKGGKMKDTYDTPEEVPGPSEILETTKNNIGAVLYQLDKLETIIPDDGYKVKLRVAYIQVSKAWHIINTIPTCLKRRKNER